MQEKILQSRVYSIKGMHGFDFSEKWQRNVEKGENIWKFVQKCTKFENILKRGRWLHAIIVHNKPLE